MNNERQSSNLDSKQDPYDWEHNHGIGFLSMVLWELGHPEEPDETLLEVLKDVRQEKDACIISLDDAREIIKEGNYVNFDYHQNQLRARQSRIEARKERQKNEAVDDDIPF